METMYKQWLRNFEDEETIEEEEKHDVPLVKCAFCGCQMTEQTEYADACDFCLQDMDCIIDEPLRYWKKERRQKAIDMILTRGIYEWILDLYKQNNVNEYEIINLVLEGLERARKRRVNENES